MKSPRTLYLVRHGPIHERYQGRCYGSSDVELSEAGKAISLQVVAKLERYPVTRVEHSGLARTRFLAIELARRTGAPVREDHRLRERDFGTWELQSWDAIYAKTGDAMDGLIDAPGQFHPPGGETTFSLRDRVWSWYQELPSTGCIVAVTHGGPIAALLGTLRSLPVRDWLTLIPEPGEIVRLT